MKFSTLFFLIWSMTVSAIAQKTFPLYNGTIPNSKVTEDKEKTEQHDGITLVRNITTPTLSVFLPARAMANGTAVIICPGGGYWVNAISHEGTDVARKFAEMGVTAFVLKYRIPNDSTMENKEIGSLQDAQQAIRIVRERGAEWNIKTDRIGIMGFSAGGHLASTAGTHFTSTVLPETNSISVRPDFMILIYPVISFQDSITHIGSRDQLIGKQPSKERIKYYSNELQVTLQTPTTFLVHASDDDVVKCQNSILFYQSLLKNNVPAEMHLYQKGGHGFGMINKTTDDLWMDSCKNWLASNGWLTQN